MAEPGTPHVIVATYTDGTERRLPCTCEWCEVWVKAQPMIDDWMTGVRNEPGVRIMQCEPVIGVHVRCEHDTSV